jgi:hypothetical protein
VFYLPFLLNVFYVLYFNLFTLSLNILFPMLYDVFIYVIGVEHVRVGHVANLCVTHLGTMYLTSKLMRCVVPELSSIFWTT